RVVTYRSIARTDRVYCTAHYLAMGTREPDQRALWVAQFLSNASCRASGSSRRQLSAISATCGLYGAKTRSGSRCTLVFMYKPTQTVAPFHGHRLYARPTLDRRPTIRRREVQAAMRPMAVV